MTDAELLTTVTAIMSNHLDKTYWTGLDSDTKVAAVEMAKGDVLARLPGQTLAAINNETAQGNPVVLAMAEQAVYLARNYGQQVNGKVVTSEAVEGLSVGYTIIGKAETLGFSARAEAYLQQAIRANRARGIRFTRG